MTEVVVTQEDVLLVDAISVEMDAYREAWFAPDKERALDHYEKAKQLAARHRTQAQAAGTVLLEADRFYIDCEFDGHNGPLLSIALVREDGDSIHIQADIEPMDLWVRRNVLPLMESHNAPKSAKVYLNEVGSVIRAFIGDCRAPTIIADSPVDIGRFC